jgi:hypothetical protein
MNKKIMDNKKNVNNEFLDLFNLINKSKKKFLLISIILLLINSIFISRIKPEQIGWLSLVPAEVANNALYKTPAHAFKEFDLNLLNTETISPNCNSRNFKVFADENFINISYKSREKEEIYECLTNIKKYIQNKENEKFNYAIQLINEKIDLYKKYSVPLKNEKDVLELEILKKSEIETHPTQQIGSIQISNNQHYPRLVIIIIVLLLSLILSMIVELFEIYKKSQSKSR